MRDGRGVRVIRRRPRGRAGPGGRPADRFICADVLMLSRIFSVASHHDLEYLLVLEHAADLDAVEQRGLGPAYVTGRDAEAPAPYQGRPRSRWPRAWAGRPLRAPVIPSTSAIIASKPAAWSRSTSRFFSEDPDDQRPVRPGQHLKVVVAGVTVLAAGERTELADPVAGVGRDLVVDVAQAPRRPARSRGACRRSRRRGRSRPRRRRS